MAYEATKIGREILDRTGRLSSLTTEGSNEGFQFAFDGRTYTGYTSNYVEDGSVYGIRKWSELEAVRSADACWLQHV